MGVYIKNLVINEISGGIVHFGNTRTISPNSTSKSTENGSSSSQSPAGSSQGTGPSSLSGGQARANQPDSAAQSAPNPSGGA